MPIDNSDTPEKDSLDILTPLLSKVFSQMGQDTNSPEVQAQIQSSATQLRRANPGVDDKTLANNVASNLPSMIGSVAGTKRVTSGADEQSELAAYKKQLQKDMQQSWTNSIIAPVGYGTNAQANSEYAKSLQDRAFQPSSAIMSGMKANKQFYENQSEAGRATQEQERGDQEGLKTTSARQDQLQKNALLDPISAVNQSMRSALKAQLAAMGVPPSALGQMESMNGPQMKMFAEGFTKTEKERADINNTIASTANTRASTAQTQAQTEGTTLDNRVKKVDADISEKSTEDYRNGTGSSGSLEGAPAGTFAKYGSKGTQDAYAANTKLLDGFNAGSGDRADTMQLIDQTLQLVNQGYSGPWANRLAAISPRLQQITKNLAAMESKQQVGQSTAAGALSAQAATPDVTKDPNTLRAYLANLSATVQRQESVAQSLNKARQGNSLGTFDVNKEAGGTRSFMLPNGKVATFTPDEMTPDVVRSLTSRNAVPISDYHGGK